MKYVRKIVTLLISVILAAAIVVGTGVIFAVKNVNVTLFSYSYEEDSAEAKQQISEFKTLISDKVRGKLIGFVKESDFAVALEGSKYVVDGCEKVYPCTLNVTVKERRETFAVRSGESFEVYDEHGVYVRTAPTKEQSYNVADGLPNVFIEGADSPAEIKAVANVSKIFKTYFTSLRTVTEKVVLSEAASQLATDNIAFYLRCGTVIEIRDYNVLTAEKISAAYAKFTSLSGEKKLGGTIYARVSSGAVIADYTPTQI